MFYADILTTKEGFTLVQIDTGISSVLSSQSTSNWKLTSLRKGKAGIHLIQNPEDNQLSIFESNTIYEIFEIFKNFTQDELRNFFLKLPEYDPQDIGLPLTFKKILRAQGWANQKI